MEKVRVDRSPKESPLDKWVSYRSSSSQHRPRCSFKWSIYLSAQAPYKVPRSNSEFRFLRPMHRGRGNGTGCINYSMATSCTSGVTKTCQIWNVGAVRKALLSRKVRKQNTSKENKTSVIAQILVHTSKLKYYILKERKPAQDGAPW